MPCGTSCDDGQQPQNAHAIHYIYVWVEIQKGKGCQKEPDVIAPEKSSIPQAIAKRMAHVAACLHKEKALVLPLQCGGLLLGEQRIGMEGEFHSAGLHIVIDQ